MEFDQVHDLAAKLIEVMIDPARDRINGASSAAPVSVEERNAIRKAAGERLLECVEFLVSSLSTMELSDSLAAEYEKYVPGHIDGSATK